MANSIAIVYFSGTGNTEAVTSFLVDEFKKHFTVDVFRVEDIIQGKQEFKISNYQMIGLGYPIHGFNSPVIIAEFLKLLKRTPGYKAFIYSTCAGPCYLNAIASYKVKRQLYKRGIQVFYERQFYMPANIATRYNDDVSKQLCDAAIKKAKKMAGEVLRKKRKVRNDHIGPYLMGWMYALEKKGWKHLVKDFKVLDTCTLCKKCVEICPMKNISEGKGKINFGKKCTVCYRCVYQCPTRSITGKLYKFAIFKDGYDIDKIINNDELPGTYITPKTWGYYGIFKKYLFKE